MHPWTGTPVRVVSSRAPIRVCDIGGWTDTWFAGHGRVFNIAVTPAVRARVEVFQNDGRPERVLVASDADAAPFARCPESSAWGPQALLEAVFYRVGVPRDLALRVTIGSGAPAGAATGTSSAVSVALVGALSEVKGVRLDAGGAAALAHSVETETLGWQAGVQDQLAAAYGGINFIEVDYPQSVVHRLEVGHDTRAALGHRLVLVYLGRGHSSTGVHEQVIRRLEGRGPDCRELDDLRAEAVHARDAILAGDLDELGRAMTANTEAQARLHPGLVGSDARAVIEAARASRAAGWKVNGAGGEGGSITILAPPEPGQRAPLIAAVEAVDQRFKVIPIALDSQGLSVTE